MNNEKITRREALKCMGTTLAGLALTASGLSSFTSCTEKKKKRLVFYFTGTGNCLYVARKFAENPLSIPQIIRQEKLEFEADEIGVVYPIYGHLAPQMVQEFIRKAKLKAPYLFSILTYGNRKCSATELWNNLATENGTCFDYITTLKMVDNFLPSFDMNEQVKIDKQEDKQIAEIMQDIQARKHWIQPVTEEERQQHAEFMQRAGHTLSPFCRKVACHQGKLHRLWNLCKGMPTPELCPDGRRSPMQRSLRILSLLRSELSAKSHHTQGGREKSRSAIPPSGYFTE